MCYDPRFVVNPKYRKIVSQTFAIDYHNDETKRMAERMFSDRKDVHILIGCGKCAACLSRRSLEWISRLSKEADHNKYCCFVTLTYDDLSIPVSSKLKPTLCKKDVQNLFKKVRKNYSGFKFRYFLVGEYGSQTNRPHYHFLLFFNSFPDYHGLNYLASVREIFRKCWTFGAQLEVLPTYPKAFYYVLKYLFKDLDYLDSDQEKPFILTSRNPAIGYCLTDEEKNFLISNLEDVGFDSSSGDYNMPAFIRKKLKNDMSVLRRKIYDKNKYEDFSFEPVTLSERITNKRLSKILLNRTRFRMSNKEKL